MIQWEYSITFHSLPQPVEEEKGSVFQCDQAGHCFVHDTSQVGFGWLENIFLDKGKEGWELVQSGYHNRELLCIWKRKKEVMGKS
jgi:hypothetical protein